MGPIRLRVDWLGLLLWEKNGVLLAYYYYYIDGSIYRHIFKSTQSASGLKALKPAAIERYGLLNVLNLNHYPSTIYSFSTEVHLSFCTDMIWKEVLNVQVNGPFTQF